MVEKAALQANTVDGNCIVIPTKTALPRRCIVTNEPIPDNLYASWDLPYVKGWLILLIFGPWMLILAPAIAKRRCKLMAGLSARLRWRYKLLKIFLILLSLSPFAVVAYAVSQKSLETLVAFGIPSMLATYFSVFAYVFFSSPLKVTKCREELYWVSGCSASFLKSLEAE